MSREGSMGYTSKLATLRALAWMKSRRGSTRSPIRVEKVSSAESAWLTRTCSSERDLGVERRFPQLLGVHLAEALVAVDLDAAAAEFHHRLDQADGPAIGYSLSRATSLPGRS